jgi:hypothetical protein
VTQTATPWALCAACTFNVPLKPDGTFPDHLENGVPCLGTAKTPAQVQTMLKPPTREAAPVALPTSGRQENVKALWDLAESVGVKTILQHLVDDMPMAKLTKLLAWVQTQQRRSTSTASADDDAVAVVVALGERRENVMRWLETAKANGAKGCDALVRLMLQERNKR